MALVHKKQRQTLVTFLLLIVSLACATKHDISVHESIALPCIGEWNISSAKLYPLHEIKQAIDVLIPQKDASESNENLVINSFDDFEDLEFAQKNKEMQLEQYVSERLKPCVGNTIFVGDIYRDVANYGYAMSYKSFSVYLDKIVDQKKIDEKEWSEVLKKVSQHDLPGNGCSRRGGTLTRATFENLAFKDIDAVDEKREQVQQYVCMNLKVCQGGSLWSNDIFKHAEATGYCTRNMWNLISFCQVLRNVVEQKKRDDAEWSIVQKKNDSKFARAYYANLTFKDRANLTLQDDGEADSPTAAMEEEARPSSSKTEQQTPKKRKETHDPEADSEASKSVRI